MRGHLGGLPGDGGGGEREGGGGVGGINLYGCVWVQVKHTMWCSVAFPLQMSPSSSLPSPTSHHPMRRVAPRSRSLILLARAQASGGAVMWLENVTDVLVQNFSITSNSADLKACPHRLLSLPPLSGIETTHSHVRTQLKKTPI